MLLLEKNPPSGGVVTLVCVADAVPLAVAAVVFCLLRLVLINDVFVELRNLLRLSALILIELKSVFVNSVLRKCF